MTLPSLLIGVALSVVPGVTPAGVLAPHQPQQSAESQEEPGARDVEGSPGQDAEARALVDRARAARGREVDGLASYEALVRERFYVGLTAERFRRERGLLRSERVARVRWESAGIETVRWLGIRHDVPVAGRAAEIVVDEPESLDTYPLDPTGDRLRFGDDTFVHPLADSAAALYRFWSGDTMRIELPALGREVVMAEVRFAPRRPDFKLLAGSLWFDASSAALIRGVFRPSREFNLELDEPEDAEDVPGFLKPIVIEVDAIAVEYGLYDLFWWLAHRVRFEGVARVGSLASFPVVLETVAEEVDVDGQALDPEAEPPAGWTRVVERDDEDDRVGDRTGGDGGAGDEEPRPNRRVVYYPPPDSLRDSPALSGEGFDRGSEAFSDEELDWIRGRLANVDAPRAGLAGPYGRLGGWRYNRVEALSASARGWLPAGDWLLSGSARIGVADGIPNLEAGAARDWGGGRFAVRGYWHLWPAADWGDPFALDASLSALVLGYDDGQYVRAAGGDLRWTREGGRVRLEARAFAENHESERKHTDLSLANLLGDADMPPNLEADEVNLFGASARVRAQVGLDPEDWIVVGSAWGEAGTGDRDYARLAAGIGVSHPIAGRLAGAVDVQAGTTFGDPPIQRQWLLGGPSTLRAFPGGSVAGRAFWLTRTELAYGLPAVRLTAFADLGWAGGRDVFWTGAPAASAGLGASLLDGLLRIDLARVLRGRTPEHIRVHVYLDGLL